MVCRGLYLPHKDDPGFGERRRMLETYCLVIIIALESAFKFPTPKIFSKTLSLDCTKLDDDDVSPGLVVAAGAIGLDARMRDGRTI